MKKRVRKVANFLAFNLLFFAVYLNFIQQDDQAILSAGQSAASSAAAFSGSLLIAQPAKNNGIVTTAVLNAQSVSLKAIPKRAIN